MKRFIPVLFLMSLFIGGLSGCSMISTSDMTQYAIDSSSFAVQVSVFKKQYSEVEELMRTKQAEKNIFTDEEWRKLLNVDASIDMLMMKADAIIQLDMDSVSLADVEMMYSIAKAGYGQAYDVISANWSKFDPSTQIMLTTLNDQAGITDTKITKLMEEPSNANITQALTLITGVVSIAVKIIGYSII